MEIIGGRKAMTAHARKEHPDDITLEWRPLSLQTVLNVRTDGAIRDMNMPDDGAVQGDHDNSDHDDHDAQIASAHLPSRAIPSNMAPNDLTSHEQPSTSPEIGGAMLHGSPHGDVNAKDASQGATLPPERDSSATLGSTPQAVSECVPRGDVEMSIHDTLRLNSVWLRMPCFVRREVLPTAVFNAPHLQTQSHQHTTPRT
jgi:hypothetical protein